MPHDTRFFDLTGKVALVTGGAGILGEHFCKGLASHGAKLIIADTNLAMARTLAASLPNAIAIEVDVSDDMSVKAMVAQATKHYDRIDILHNNAASKSSDFERFFDSAKEFDMDIWREIMSVNLDGMFLVARAVGELMCAQGKGSIIQTASIYGVLAPDQRIYEGSEYRGIPINTPAVYSASKAGVVGLTKYLASYWGDKGVRVNTLTPGGVESGQNDTFKQRYAARVPMGRMAKPQEMVGALIFLASDASSYITGQNIIIDGGLSVW